MTRPQAQGLGIAPRYGGAQAGAVLRYALGSDQVRDPHGYLRLSTALARPHDPEVALGVALRPMRRVPMRVMAEVRATRLTSGIALRPAVLTVSEAPALDLPGKWRLESYAAAGYVGGKGATGFIDGQARIDRAVARHRRAELRIGGGLWGGAQRGAARLDVGLGLGAAIPAGPGLIRVYGDWRWRVAGNATPGNGPVLTIAAGL